MQICVSVIGGLLHISKLSICVSVVGGSDMQICVSVVGGLICKFVSRLLGVCYANFVSWLLGVCYANQSVPDCRHLLLSFHPDMLMAKKSSCSCPLFTVTSTDSGSRPLKNRKINRFFMVTGSCKFSCYPTCPIHL